MAWYRTGTVAVTAGDTVITGAGTLFATHARVGDGFVGPDGRMYEVTNIASETVLAIFPPYQGVTAAGQEYGIIPVQGYPKQLADRAGEMVDQVGQLPVRIDDIEDVLALLGNIANQNFPEGVSKFGNSAWLDLAAGVTSFGTAAGANLDTLLTKAGNLAGLGDKAQSQLNLGVIQTLAGKVLNTDNVTYQNTSNGHTWRFSEHRVQICWLTFTLPSLSVTNAYGPLYQTTYVFPYPAAFVSAPSAAPSGTLAGAAAWATINGTPGLTSAGLRIIDAYSSTAAANISVIVIGKY